MSNLVQNLRDITITVSPLLQYQHQLLIWRPVNHSCGRTLWADFLLQYFLHRSDTVKITYFEKYCVHVPN